MTDRVDRSANELESLVLKAARGGEIPLGAAEDLAAAVPYMDLDDITLCPCNGADPAAVFVPVALDLVAAGEGPQTVEGDGAVISALVAGYEVRMGRKLSWRRTAGGAVFERFSTGAVMHESRGRRAVSEALLDHLQEMAAKTLVPETEASRSAGAGAGLTDND